VKFIRPPQFPNDNGDDPMTITIKNHLEKRLNFYEDKSTRDTMAEILNEFEVFLGGFLELYESISEFDRAWRLTVFRGVVAYRPRDHQDINKILERWITIGSAIEKPLYLFESTGVAGADSFRKCLTEARRTLQNNEAPRISAAVGLRRIKVDAAGSRMIREMLRS
jgi:hypothetical protein